MKRPEPTYDTGVQHHLAGTRPPHYDNPEQNARAAQQTSFAALREVQKQANGQPEEHDVHAAAAHGISGTSTPLPFLATIQQAFGRHDVSNVQAHVDHNAKRGASAMGAEAYATGNHVAFAGSPNLHTAAHEAAHVIQQRAGVQLKGGVGEVGDPYERHADAVADGVVAGRNVEGLLDEMAGAGGTGHGVQCKAAPTQEVQRQAGAAELPAENFEIHAIQNYATLMVKRIYAASAKVHDLILKCRSAEDAGITPTLQMIEREVVEVNAGLDHLAAEISSNPGLMKGHTYLNPQLSALHGAIENGWVGALNEAMSFAANPEGQGMDKIFSIRTSKAKVNAIFVALGLNETNSIFAATGSAKDAPDLQSAETDAIVSSMDSVRRALRQVKANPNISKSDQAARLLAQSVLTLADALETTDTTHLKRPAKVSALINEVKALPDKVRSDDLNAAVTRLEDKFARINQYHNMLDAQKKLAHKGPQRSPMYWLDHDK
jgi:hypothetical protein